MQLRYVQRDGQRILQFSVVVYNEDTKKNETYWQNVPLVEFIDE